MLTRSLSESFEPGKKQTDNLIARYHYSFAIPFGQKSPLFQPPPRANKGQGLQRRVDHRCGRQRGAKNRPAHAGPAFDSAESTKLFVHACKEAKRLDLELSLNIQSGWNLGGPVVTATPPLRGHSGPPPMRNTSALGKTANGSPAGMRNLLLLRLPAGPLFPIRTPALGLALKRAVADLVERPARGGRIFVGVECLLGILGIRPVPPAGS